MNGMISSVYVHVPFCAQKCEYCAFYSESGQLDKVDRYVDCLLREFRSAPSTFGRGTIFFGGGTPSILTMKQWERLLKGMHETGWCGAAEWTVECNPATVSMDKARLLRDAGVNRISMGVQSLDERLLDRLGRVHSREMVFKSYDILRSAGFSNINLDLMFGIPSQSFEIWQATLNEAMAMDSEHLSCYEVIYEEDTPLFDQMKAGEFDVDEDLTCRMYDELVDRAVKAGFHPYEVANFGRGTWRDEDGIPERACRHNVNYWQGGNCIAFGPSATGYVNGVRTRNWANTGLYCDCVEAGRPPVESREELAPLGRAGETAAFGLRMVDGLREQRFQAVTGMHLEPEWTADINGLVEEGLGERYSGGFRLTRQGLRFADMAAERFLRSGSATER